MILFNNQQNIQNSMNSRIFHPKMLLFLTLLTLVFSQNATVGAGLIEKNTQGYIQTRKLFLFDTTSGFQPNASGSIYSFTFEHTFVFTPRVGLAVYTMDFEYSPSFSCRVTGDTTPANAKLNISTTSLSQANQLYIMYIATDHDLLGVFMPGSLFTNNLNNPINNERNSQQFVYNFKEQISANSIKENIRLSVYLTGISSTSELVANGYAVNHTYFSIQSKVLNSSFYQLNISVQSLYGDITISLVECTIIYFDIGISRFRYLMDSSAVSLYNYGGTNDVQTKTAMLTQLPTNSSFSNLQIFFGISSLECKQGASITLLGVQKYYKLSTSSDLNVLLQMQTWKLTIMLQSTYNYILLKSLICDPATGIGCDNSCTNSTRPHYIIQTTGCGYCQSSCASCNISNSGSVCDTCDKTRLIDNSTKLCNCLIGFYESGVQACSECWPCATCDKKDVCLTCDTSKQLIINTVLSVCQCAPLFYPAPMNGSVPPKDAPCLACSAHCLYCTSSTNCLACDLTTYNYRGLCIPQCTSTQKFSNQTLSCSAFSSNSGNLFDQLGRFGYDWTYRNVGNQMMIDLTFSQPSPAYYYYQNGSAYLYQILSGVGPVGQNLGQFYYDDGTYMQGYSAAGSANANMGLFGGVQGSSSILSMGQQQVTGNAGAWWAGANGWNQWAYGNSAYQLYQGGRIDQSALRGDYYGYGQTNFYNTLYNNYMAAYNYTSYYPDQSGIPFGKYNLSSNQALPNPNYLDALSQNLQLQVGNKTIPFTVVPVSANQFTLVTTPGQSFNSANAVLSVKNPALIRDGNTSLQVSSVGHMVSRYDCQTPTAVASAQGIHDSNSIIVQVLWGLSKYPLFIGFGWPFMPIMLVLQYIMSLNYLNTQMPLNLNYFLSSFSDFRNPSILYNPMRNNFDASIFNYPQLYKTIPQYNVFDRGIDFMKNCFQFFFVPFLAMCLLGILALVNLAVNKACGKDISLIRHYLMPRWPLLIAAYTLVQALPISFFFWAQLNDTKYHSKGQPSGSYLSFNTVMSYLAFFLTLGIPLVLMAYIYNVYSMKQEQVSNANQFKLMFLGLVEGNGAGRVNRAGFDDPLWGGNTARTSSYGFGISVFYLAVLFGFFISFFIYSFPWQITGIIVSTALFLAFAAASSHFIDNFSRYFWIIFSILMIAFLLLLAGVGSNVSTASCDQENLGFLGIGFLYAMMIAALILSGYLIWKTGSFIYDHHIGNGKFFTPLMAAAPAVALAGQAPRVDAFQNDQKQRSMYLKNSTLNQQQMSAMGGAAMALVGQGQDDNLDSAHRMLNRNVLEESSMRQALRYQNNNFAPLPYGFSAVNTGQMYYFPRNVGQQLKERMPLQIDAKRNIYASNMNEFIGNYYDLSKSEEDAQIRKKTFQMAQMAQMAQMRKLAMNEENQDNRMMVGARQGSNQQLLSQNELALITGRNIQSEINISNTIIINGQQYKYQGTDAQGRWKLRNLSTGEVIYKLQSELQISQSKAVLQSNQFIQAGKKEQQSNQFLQMGEKIENNELNIYEINGQQYLQQGLDEQGRLKLRNRKTGEVIYKFQSEFHITSSKNFIQITKQEQESNNFIQMGGPNQSNRIIAIDQGAANLQLNEANIRINKMREEELAFNKAQLARNNLSSQNIILANNGSQNVILGGNAQQLSSKNVIGNNIGGTNQLITITSSNNVGQNYGQNAQQSAQQINLGQNAQQMNLGQQINLGKNSQQSVQQIYLGPNAQQNVQQMNLGQNAQQMMNVGRNNLQQVITQNQKQGGDNNIVMLKASDNNEQIVFSKSRKIIIDNQEYYDYGEKNGEFILKNANTGKELRMSEKQYLESNLNSFNRRITYNGGEYNYQKSDNGMVYLTDLRTGKTTMMTIQEYNRTVEAHKRAFNQQVGRMQKSIYEQNLLIQSKAQPNKIQPIGVKQPFVISNKEYVRQENMDDQIESELNLQDIIDDYKDYVVKLVPTKKIQLDKDGTDTYDDKDVEKQFTIKGAQAKTIDEFIEKTYGKNKYGVFLADGDQEYRLDGLD